MSYQSKKQGYHLSLMNHEGIKLKGRALPPLKAPSYSVLDFRTSTIIMFLLIESIITGIKFVRSKKGPGPFDIGCFNIS